MRTPPAKLQQLIEPVVQGLGYELIGIECLSRGHAMLLRIFIDRAAGIMVEDCERVSHQVSGVLEVEDPITSPYTLEVSSPGLDRPLFNAGQFAHYIGREARVRVHVPIGGRHNFRGTIVAVNGEDVRINVDGEEYLLEASNVDKANLVPQFEGQRARG